MIEILFLLGFTLHNIEEAIWLPEWSRNAGRFSRQTKPGQFYFAVIIITAIGYLLTFQYFVFSETYICSQYIYFGFIATMVLNVPFPHIIASIILRKYAPGTLTGILLNFPIGTYILFNAIETKQELGYLAIATLMVTVIILVMIRLLNFAGKNLIETDPLDIKL